jgi:hypothetical protein
MLVTYGCSPPHVSSHPKSVKIADISGIWVADYSENIFADKEISRAIEIIKLREDGMYQQIFDNNAGYRYESSLNTWKIEKQKEGEWVVILHDMRYFPDGIKNIEISKTVYPEFRLFIENASTSLFGLNSRLIICFGDLDLNLCFERESEYYRRQKNQK